MTNRSPLESVFFAALDQSGAEARAAYLDEACADDAELRKQVEKMLAAHAGADDFLERPPATPVVPFERILPEADIGCIGPYKLLQQIGEGGMGAVWMAQQTEPVRRLVALKLIKTGLDSKQVVARFEAERQALALMDHPNIARVLDAGATDRGRPYFVMDLVKGSPITEYCDAHRLTTRQRLELFVPVCQAIQHAHQKGVIHRDLKPTNVLVALYDGKPIPKVIDFGVAKAVGQPLTDKTLFTGFGNIVGTLEYMSPEQAEFNQLDVDTRSDVYALGALLYELLTGGPPFACKDLEKAGMLEMLRTIREQEPSKPSTKLSTAEGLPTLAANRGTEPAKLTSLVKGELDWIAMKALEKDRNRRYETAASFANDVLRYLADDPVLACPPSTAYRLRKFARRNRAKLTATAAIALSLCVGGGAWWTAEAKADSVRTAAETERVTREARATAGVSAAVRDARERSAEAWKSDDYPDRMQSATEAALAAVRRADDYAANGPPTDVALAELTAARREVAELARHTDLIATHAQNVRRFIDEVHFESDVEPIWTLCLRHGEALRKFGVDPMNGAVEANARTVADSRIRDTLLGVLLEWQYHVRNHAEGRSGWLGGQKIAPEARAAAGRLDPVVRRARQLCGGAYAHWQALLDRKDGEGLVAFAGSPDALGFRSTLVAALARDLGWYGLKEYAAARDFLRAAVDRYPHDMMLHYDLAGVCQHLQPADFAESLRHMSAAQTLRPDSTLFNMQVGTSYAGLGRREHAMAAYRKTISLNPRYVAAHVWLGNELLALQEWEAAALTLKEAVHYNPDHAPLRTMLGLALTSGGKNREALDATLAALRHKPTWAENPRNYLRYNVACFSVLCADGKGCDPPPTAERPALRKRALALLNSELATWRKLFAKDAKFIGPLADRILVDADLQSVREPTEIAQLPVDERDGWTKFWREVGEFRERTAPSSSAPSGVAKNPTGDAPKSGLKGLQGKWERVSTTQHSSAPGPTKAVKAISGSKEVVTWYDAEGKVTRAHAVAVRLEESCGLRTLAYSEMEILDGPSKGQKVAVAGSYVYRVDGDMLYESGGMSLADGAHRATPYLAVWKRIPEK